MTLTLTHNMSPWRLPAGFNCSEYFFLNVRDGTDANAPVLGHYCTNTVPPSITSSASLTYIYTPKIVYRVTICPRGNLPYIQIYPINNTICYLIYQSPSEARGLRY